jgi:hypothetical protein
MNNQARVVLRIDINQSSKRSSSDGKVCVLPHMSSPNCTAQLQRRINLDTSQSGGAVGG